MLDRILFKVRRFSLELGPRLGSWRLSIVLMLVLALDYVFLAIWSTSSPTSIVQDIALLIPFWLAYGLLLVNTGVCLWRRLPVLRRQLSREPLWSSRPHDWQVAVGEGCDAAAGRRLLRRLGYQPLAGPPETVAGVRQRLAGLGTYFFHGSFFLLALGFSLTLFGHQETRIRVAEGETFTASPEQISARTAPGLLPGALPSTEFVLEKVQPKFWEDQLLFTELRGDLVFAGEHRQSTWINHPIWLGGVTFMRMAGFGYAPRYELLDRDGLVLDTAFVKLNVFPPGQRDFFTPNRFPHRVYMEVLPDLGLEGDRAITRSLNLVNPGYPINVHRGRLNLGGDVLRPGESYPFEGMTLSFPEIRYWGEFSIVRDPGAPFVFAGFLLGLTGLLLKVRGPRREAEWVAASATQPAQIRGWGGAAPKVTVSSPGQGAPS